MRLEMAANLDVARLVIGLRHLHIVLDNIMAYVNTCSSDKKKLPYASGCLRLVFVYVT